MSRMETSRPTADPAVPAWDPDDFELLHGRCPNLEAALSLASRGLKVFPIQYRKRKDEWTPISGWQSKGTADPEVIRKLWNWKPEPRVGLPMGAINGMVALDVDRKNGKDGFTVLHALGLDLETITPSRTATPNGGEHLFFAFTEGLKNWVGGTKKELPPGLDIRTDGGFVVAPGTVKSLMEWYQPLGKPLGTVELPPFPEEVSEPLLMRETSETHHRPAGAHIQSKSCRLTPLGEHYRRLVMDDRI